MPIQRLTMTNLLSFGAGERTLELGALNVLIGPNGSGKSNLVDVFSVLSALPTDLAAAFRTGNGGLADWFYGGVAEAQSEAGIEVLSSSNVHRLLIEQDGFLARVADERIARRRSDDRPSSHFAFAYVQNIARATVGNRDIRPQRFTEISRSQSVVAQLNDKVRHPEITSFRQEYAGLRIYRGFDWNRNSARRKPQRTDVPSDFLLPSGENLAVVLNSLNFKLETWSQIKQAMAKLLPDFLDIQFQVLGSQILIYFAMRGCAAPIGISRLSDGTLNYLSLLAILLHPNPPGLICIEEPEAGLHPDMIGDLARHIEDAATRTQVVITTHSDLLVSALSHRPEAIIVVERGENGTELTRLEPARLAGWLEKYRLGELWSMGEIGGNRW